MNKDDQGGSPALAAAAPGYVAELSGQMAAIAQAADMRITADILRLAVATAVAEGENRAQPPMS